MGDCIVNKCSGGCSKSDQLREGHRRGQTLAREELEGSQRGGSIVVPGGGGRDIEANSQRDTGAMLELLILF